MSMILARVVISCTIHNTLSMISCIPLLIKDRTYMPSYTCMLNLWQLPITPPPPLGQNAGKSGLFLANGF